MKSALTLLLLAGIGQPGGDPPAQDPKQAAIDFALNRNQPWQKAYSEVALATLDAGERAALEKLKPLGFRAEGRGPGEFRFFWKDGQKFLEAPLGVALDYGAPPLKPGSKPGLMKDLAPLAELRHVEMLRFRHRNVTDDMVEWLKGMNDMWHLDLSFTRITDAGLKKLAHMKGLRHLYLVGVEGLTDAGGPALATLPALTTLELSRTRVGDRGVTALAKSVNLESLSLRETPVGDAGVVALAELPKLQALALSKTRITDNGLAAMALPGCFSRLLTLGLSDTAVTDEGLKALHDPNALPKLRLLCLSGTKVTDAGVAALQNARPGLDIDRPSIAPRP